MGKFKKVDFLVFLEVMAPQKLILRGVKMNKIKRYWINHTPKSKDVRQYFKIAQNENEKGTELEVSQGLDFFNDGRNAGLIYLTYTSIPSGLKFVRGLSVPYIIKGSIEKTLENFPEVNEEINQQRRKIRETFATN